MTSQDDAFRAKRDDVLHVYYDVPAREHILSLDEKTGIQAVERRHADLPLGPGQPVRREFEYVRHGTLTLMGAFDVRTGKAFGFCSEDRTGQTFVDLLELVDLCYPTGRGHLVCDNQSIHDTDDAREWLDEHPRWTLHFTPTHASWLNQIEGWFAILQRRVLTRGSFPSTDDLRDKIYEYMCWHDADATPFHWSYRPASWARKSARTSAAVN